MRTYRRLFPTDESLVGGYDAYVERAVVGEVGGVDGDQEFFHKGCVEGLYRVGGQIVALPNEHKSPFFDALAAARAGLLGRETGTKELQDFADSKLGVLPGPIADICREGRVRVKMVINSNGGRRFSGNVVRNALEAIRANGGMVDSYVLSMAASAAAMIFSSADNRYVFPFSEVMWHLGHVASGISGFSGPEMVEEELQFWLEGLRAEGVEATEEMIEEERRFIVSSNAKFVEQQREENWMELCGEIESLVIGEKIAEIRAKLEREFKRNKEPDKAMVFNARKLKEYGMATVFGKNDVSVGLFLILKFPLLMRSNEENSSRLRKECRIDYR